MAHLYRLVSALCLCLCLFGIAHAAFPPSVQGYYVYSGEKYFRGATKDAACNAYHVYYKTTSYEVYNDWQCVFYRYDGSGYVLAVSSDPASCPANSTSSAGNTCTCSSGFKEDGSQCVPAVSATAVCNKASIEAHSWGSSASTVWSGRIQDGSSTCYVPYPEQYPSNGCSIEFEMDFSWQNDDGSWSTRGRYTPALAGTSGIPCVPGGSNGPDPTPSNPKAEPTRAPCTSGYPGTVNGVSLCVPNVSKSGIDYVPKITVDENESERVERSESTSCSGGKCTTTTTTTTTNKSTGTSTTATSSQTVSDRDYCKQSANSSNCSGGQPAYGGGAGDGDGDGDGDESEKSAFGGSCSAGFTCSGDAIQCAIAREQHKRNCEANDANNDEFRVYAAAKNVTGKVTDSLEGNESFDVGSIVTNASDRFLSGRGVCPPNRIIQGPNWRLEIPYSTICPYLEILGNILVVITSIAAIRIIAKRS